MFFELQVCHSAHLALCLSHGWSYEVGPHGSTLTCVLDQHAQSSFRAWKRISSLYTCQRCRGTGDQHHLADFRIMKLWLSQGLWTSVSPECSHCLWGLPVVSHRSFHCASSTLPPLSQFLGIVAIHSKQLIQAKQKCTRLVFLSIQG